MKLPHVTNIRNDLWQPLRQPCSALQRVGLRAAARSCRRYNDTRLPEIARACVCRSWYSIAGSAYTASVRFCRRRHPCGWDGCAGLEAVPRVSAPALSRFARSCMSPSAAPVRRSGSTARNGARSRAVSLPPRSYARRGWSSWSSPAKTPATGPGVAGASSHGGGWWLTTAGESAALTKPGRHRLRRHFGSRTGIFLRGLLASARRTIGRSRDGRRIGGSIHRIGVVARGGLVVGAVAAEAVAVVAVAVAGPPAISSSGCSAQP